MQNLINKTVKKLFKEGYKHNGFFVCCFNWNAQLYHFDCLKYILNAKKAQKGSCQIPRDLQKALLQLSSQ